VADQQQDPGSQLNLVKNMLAVRRQHLALGLGRLEWADVGANPAVLAFYRGMPEEMILTVHNLSREEQSVAITDVSDCRFENLFTSQKVVGTRGSLKLALEPYEYLWLKKA
jgi:maltose alpha-D-glucosyltransferase/alpha-amylase